MKSALKWVVSVVVAITLPLWIIPVIFIGMFCHGVSSLHDDIWGKR